MDAPWKSTTDFRRRKRAVLKLVCRTIKLRLQTFMTRVYLFGCQSLQAESDHRWSAAACALSYLAFWLCLPVPPFELLHLLFAAYLIFLCHLRFLQWEIKTCEVQTKIQREICNILQWKPLLHLGVSITFALMHEQNFQLKKKNETANSFPSLYPLNSTLIQGKHGNLESICTHTSPGIGYKTRCKISTCKSLLRLMIYVILILTERFILLWKFPRNMWECYNTIIFTVTLTQIKMNGNLVKQQLTFKILN